MAFDLDPSPKAWFVAAAPATNVSPPYVGSSPASVDDALRLKPPIESEEAIPCTNENETAFGSSMSSIGLFASSSSSLACRRKYQIVPITIKANRSTLATTTPTVAPLYDAARCNAFNASAESVVVVVVIVKVVVVVVSEVVVVVSVVVVSVVVEVGVVVAVVVAVDVAVSVMVVVTVEVGVDVPVEVAVEVGDVVTVEVGDVVTVEDGVEVWVVVGVVFRMQTSSVCSGSYCSSPRGQSWQD